MATFTWTPDFGASAEYKPRVRVAKFGDGYEQRVGDGINTGQDTWNLRFSVRSDLETGAILAFLETRASAEAFDWTPPGGIGPIRVVCREWNRSFDRNDQNTVSTKFELVYEP